jgi:uncharacterized repeat protein (TIGR03803 family)
MRIFGLLCMLIVIAGCANERTVLPAQGPGLARPFTGSADGFEVIYKFRLGVHVFDGKHGTNPDSSLVFLNGLFYGTTANGGTICSGGGCTGVAYSITPLGKQRVIFDFGKTNEESWLPNDLIVMDGKLYGTAMLGPAQSECCGQVFELSPSGTYRILYSFTGGSDGGWPVGLTGTNGTLYGTTRIGGDSTCQCGTVFSVSTSGKERTLHQFQGSHDGAAPLSAPIVANGVIYGTASAGGNRGCAGLYYDGPWNCGIVYSVTRSGTERVLHAFSKADHGGYAPWGGVLFHDGRLYGTTTFGGSDKSFGTVFETDISSGTTRALYRFKGGTDGAFPKSGLALINETLYGTTYEGGNGGKCFGYLGCGTLYSVGLDGTEHVLHAFTSSQAFGTAATPTFYNDALYGTAYGNMSTTAGTVYKQTL